MNSRHLGSGRDDPAGCGYLGDLGEHVDGLNTRALWWWQGRVWLPAYEEQRNLPALHVFQVFSRPEREILGLDSVGTQCSEGG